MVSSALLLAAIAPAVLGQTFSKCKDDLPSCPDNMAQKQAVLDTKFGSGGTPPAGWKQAVCKGKTSYDANGVGLTVAESGDCPAVESENYFFFGMVEVKMKAAPGQGIVSSIVMESDALDEVDWEFIGGEDYRVQSNYFGKADTTTYDRMVYIPAADNQNTFHTYGVNWTSSAITWLVNGAPVRTLKYQDAKGGTRFPQTPMKLKVGAWAGGDPKMSGEGTVTWAGGETDFAKGPFSMYVESIKVTNYSPADMYKYKDNSGSWESIDVIGGSTGGILSPEESEEQQSSIDSATATVTGVEQGTTAVPVSDLPIGGNATAGSSNGTASLTTSTAGGSTFVNVATPTGPTSARGSGSSAATATANAAPFVGSAAFGASGLLALAMAIFA